MDTPDQILNGFFEQCAQLSMDHALFVDLFMSGEKQIELLRRAAPLFFEDLYRLMRNSLFTQFCRITDPAGSGTRTNLTSNHILKSMPWPPAVKRKLAVVNNRLMQFRAYVEPARNKRLAHADLRAELDRVTLGAFPAGADRQFIKDLGEFLTIAQEYLGRPPVSLSIGGSHDAHALVRNLVEARIYKSCPRCTEFDRNIAVLDFERDHL